MNNPETVGDYKILKQIGQGSLGTVYLVEHRFIKKQFALKLLPEELSRDRAFIRRFEEEVAKLAMLEHPNIVKVHNISYDDGVYFLVTDCVVDEYGETKNLAQHLLERQERFAEKDLLRLLKQIASALDFGHLRGAGGSGIIHRGIKLNNLLIDKDEHGMKWVLSDYGLSRIIGVGAVLNRTFRAMGDALSNGYAGLEESTKITSLHASFLQNWNFLAPEQKRWDGTGVINHKADVYAFGVLVYFLIGGTFPEGHFPLPAEMAREYRMNWDRLVKECLRPDPEKRPEQLLPLLEGLDVRCESVEMYQCLPKKREVKVPETVAAYTGNEVFRPIIKDPKIERPVYEPDPAATLQVDPTVKYYQPERKEVRDIQPIHTDMVVIKGGTFVRGSSDGNRDEMPMHPVHLLSFAIDIHPITNEQFVRFLEVMGGEKDSNNLDLIRLRDSRIKRRGGKLSIESGYTKHPVVGVTWYGAVAYAKWVGKRLPTEAEWEVAAKGGVDQMLYSTGDDIERSQANFFSSDTTVVMSYAPNPVGLYDMAGNVYEWSHDWYGYNYYEVSQQEPDNPKGPLQGNYRVLRGGCWKSLKEDLRCSRRHRNNPGTVNSTYGFRCATDVQEENV